MIATKPRVLIVDDEQVVRRLLYNELSERGYLCSIAVDGHDAVAKLAIHDFDVVLLDIKLPGKSGIEILSILHSSHSHTIPIMITAVNCIDTAVEAMKLGALDYIVKPFDLDKLNENIQMLLETKRQLSEGSDCQTPLCLSDNEEEKPVIEGYYRSMDAIARGVEARWDLLFGHSEIVAQETINIASQLGIPQEIIQRWADARSGFDSERSRIIEHSLHKLQRSPLAQWAMGITVPYWHTPKLDESQN